ncbi:hypothetical protein K6U49_08415, partial [Vibrio alginolyticus]|nr:hypothetical protein [Vibrio alginolyticus]
MLQSQFHKLIKLLPKLTDNQSVLLEQFLRGVEPVSQVIRELEQRVVDSPECPHCHSSVIPQPISELKQC